MRYIDHPPHPSHLLQVGDYVLDFVCMQTRVVVECDGGPHDESLRDKRRDDALRIAGFTVLRFWNNDILSNLEGVRSRIIEACRQSETHPHSDPLLKERGKSTECSSPF